jgi:plasmid maintenance system killer protein
MLNPGNKFHALSGNRKGQYAISINKQWCVCFEWQDGNAYHLNILAKALNIELLWATDKMAYSTASRI